MASVLVNVSKFGNPSQATDNVRILTSPAYSSIFLFVAAKTASSRSRPIPNF